MCRYCGNDGKCKKGQDNPNIQDGSSNSRLIEDEETVEFIRPFAFEGSSLNRMNSAPPDPMHDLPEGVLENVFEFLLKYIVGFGLLTKEKVEERFNDFSQHFYEGNPTLKSDGALRVTWKLSGKAIQVEYLFIILKQTYLLLF